jgi:hypothetical protein
MRLWTHVVLSGLDWLGWVFVGGTQLLADCAMERGNSYTVGLSTEHEYLWSGRGRSPTMDRCSADEYLVATGEAVEESGFRRIGCALSRTSFRMFLPAGSADTESLDSRCSSQRKECCDCRAEETASEAREVSEVRFMEGSCWRRSPSSGLCTDMVRGSNQSLVLSRITKRGRGSWRGTGGWYRAI